MSMRWPTFLDGPEISISGGCESRFFVTLSWLTSPTVSFRARCRHMCMVVFALDCACTIWGKVMQASESYHTGERAEAKPTGETQSSNEVNAIRFHHTRD